MTEVLAWSGLGVVDSGVLWQNPASGILTNVTIPHFLSDSQQSIDAVEPAQIRLSGKMSWQHFLVPVILETEQGHATAVYISFWFPCQLGLSIGGFQREHPNSARDSNSIILINSNKTKKLSRNEISGYTTPILLGVAWRLSLLNWVESCSYVWNLVATRLLIALSLASNLILRDSKHTIWK